jgi:hypothetical protein
VLPVGGETVGTGFVQKCANLADVLSVLGVG